MHPNSTCISYSLDAVAEDVESGCCRKLPNFLQLLRFRQHYVHLLYAPLVFTLSYDVATKHVINNNNNNNT